MKLDYNRLDAVAAAIDEVTYEAGNNFVGSRVMAERLAGALYRKGVVIVRVADVSAAIVALPAANKPLADRWSGLLDESEPSR